VSPLGPIRLCYEVELAYQVNSNGADFIFNVQAARTAQQRVLQESLFISQDIVLREHTDPTTSGRFLRVRAAAGELILRYCASVELRPVGQAAADIPETWIPYLPVEVLPYLYPSRYCESDLLASVALAEFGSMWQGYSRVQAVCDWVKARIQFESESSSTSTTAMHTLAQGRGVCRDFSHLMIALTRALNIPARFVTGLDYGADPELGPTDFHAYVEAYLGDRWYIFDPSGTTIPMGLIRLTAGRDASECAYASIFGDVVPLTRSLTIKPVAFDSGELVEPYHTEHALSTDKGAAGAGSARW
jgi:transglutaminase-like putative cysteine protease